MTFQDNIKETLILKESAKATFSKFKVGALLITEDGRIYRGVNIEVSSYSLTICAERVAIFKAISEGEHKFKTIFIASDSEKITSPCGACRQVLWELAGDIDVVMINKHGEYKISKMNELLPISFDKTYL